MRKVIFLDRDGVINMERGEYTYKWKDFEFVPGLFDALKLLKKKGYDFVVVTNQSGIAKGVYTHHDFHQVNEKMLTRLTENGIEILEVYYSPQHPDYSESLCRKPGSLMIEKALARFQIDPAASYIIGDKKRDVEAGEKVGVKGILVEANTSLEKIIDQIQ